MLVLCADGLAILDVQIVLSVSVKALTVSPNGIWQWREFGGGVSAQHFTGSMGQQCQLTHSGG